MKISIPVLTSVIGSLLAVSPLTAHEVKDIEHTHPFEDKAYSSDPQVRSVNNHLGNISIKSAKPSGGYQTGSPVEFARPEPITKPPSMPFINSTSKNEQAAKYGKTTKKDYGKSKKD